MLIGYARVSTDEQDLRMQMEALIKAGVHPDHLYTDKQSGKSMRRKGLEHALLDARPGDVLVVWKLDRLSRSLKDLIMLSERLAADGIELRSLHEQIDTTNPMSRFFFHLMSALAEFERGLIGWRTSQGMQAAKQRGVRFGPAPILGPNEVKQSIQMLKSGRSVRSVARHFRVTAQLVRVKVLATYGKPLWPTRRRKKVGRGTSTGSS